MDTTRKTIYGNGEPLVIEGTEAGTTIYIDADRDGVLDADEPSLKKAGVLNAPEDNADLSAWRVYGGGAAFTKGDTLYNCLRRLSPDCNRSHEVAVCLHGLLYTVPTASKKGVLLGSDALAVDPVVYLTLPTGLTCETLKFTLNEVRFDGTASNNQPLTHSVENVSYLNTTGDGVSIYKITFPAGTTLGHYSEEGSRFLLYYTIKLQTSKSMETKRYELNRLIGVSTKNNMEAMPYSSNPATLNTVMPDIYAMNGGKDYAGIAKGITTEQPGFGLQQLAEINVYNAVSVTKINGKPTSGTWQTYDPSDPNSVVSLGKNSEGQLRLNIQNTSDSASGALELLLPIPKKGVDMGDVFTEGPSAFPMSMTIPTAELAAENFSGKYVTVSGTHDVYDSKISYTDSDAANANAILLTASAVPAGADLSFRFPFTVTAGEAGATNIWRNAFQYTTSENVTSYKTGSFVASSVAGSSITGVVFDDKNRNGLREASEQGVPGVTVVVKDSENKILSAVTDAAGGYDFLAVRETPLITLFAADADGLAEGAADIIGLAQGEVLKFYDFSVYKTVTKLNGEPIITNLHQLPNTVQVEIALSDALKDRSAYRVYRYHDGAAQAIPHGPIADITGQRESFELSADGTRLILHTRRLSTYAVVGSETALGGTGTVERGETGMDVQAQMLEGGDGPVYKVDIAFGNMYFTYSTGRTWDPDEHRYTDVRIYDWIPEVCYTGGNNKVTVFNHSNADVSVGFAVDPILKEGANESLLNGVDMVMNSENRADGTPAQAVFLSKVPAEGAAAPSIHAYLRLNGSPTDPEFYKGLVTDEYGFVQVADIAVIIGHLDGPRTPKE